MTGFAIFMNFVTCNRIDHYFSSSIVNNGSVHIIKEWCLLLDIFFFGLENHNIFFVTI